jgi:hypothetical protein
MSLVLPSDSIYAITLLGIARANSSDTIPAAMTLFMATYLALKSAKNVIIHKNIHIPTKHVLLITL